MVKIVEGIELTSIDMCKDENGKLQPCIRGVSRDNRTNVVTGYDVAVKGSDKSTIVCVAKPNGVDKESIVVGAKAMGKIGVQAFNKNSDKIVECANAMGKEGAVIIRQFGKTVSSLGYIISDEVKRHIRKQTINKYRGKKARRYHLGKIK